MYVDYKAKFFIVYANLPYALRSELIAVIDDQTFTWNSAKLEIENDSSIGIVILNKLKEMNILREDQIKI